MLWEEATRVAALVGPRMGALPVRFERDVDVSSMLARARALIESALFDQAADELDGALELAAKAPFRVTTPERVLDALVARAAIALARNEESRAQDLLTRLLRYDPVTPLSEEEETPPVHRALTAVRARAGVLPEMRPTDLGQPCDRADRALVVARALGPRIEWTLWVGCTRRASTILPTVTADSNVASALVPKPLEPPPTTTPVAAPRPWGPWIVAGAGVAVLVGGFVLRQSVGDDYDRLSRECVDGRCPSSRYDDFKAREQVGVALMTVGSVAIVSGVVWWLLHPTEPQPSGTRASVGLGPGPGWAGLSAQGSF